MINNNQAHTNVIMADSIFQMDDTGELANAPFFDIEDDCFIKGDLWLTATIALELADWFYGINNGRDVIEFAPGFVDEVQALAKGTDSLRAEIVETDRYKAAMAKINTRVEKS